MDNNYIYNKFSIEYEVPSCPDYIEELEIHDTNINRSENIYDTNYISDVNNIRNCMFSLYEWNYLFLKVMVYIFLFLYELN